MANEEIKKKISEIIGDVYLVNAPIKDVFNPIFIEKIADAMIAAEIGDVREWKHREEKEERALKDMCRAYEVLKGTSFDELFCKTTCRYVLSLEHAEKELAEEGKND